MPPEQGFCVCSSTCGLQEEFRKLLLTNFNIDLFSLCYTHPCKLTHPTNYSWLCPTIIYPKVTSCLPKNTSFLQSQKMTLSSIQMLKSDTSKIPLHSFFPYILQSIHQDLLNLLPKYLSLYFSFSTTSLV